MSCTGAIWGAGSDAADQEEVAPHTPDCDRPPHSKGIDRVVVLVEADQAGVRIRAREPCALCRPVRRVSYGVGARIENLPDRLLPHLPVCIVRAKARQRSSGQLFNLAQDLNFGRSTKSRCRLTPTWPFFRPMRVCRRPARPYNVYIFDQTADCRLDPRQRRSHQRRSSCCHKSRDHMLQRRKQVSSELRNENEMSVPEYGDQGSKRVAIETAKST